MASLSPQGASGGVDVLAIQGQLCGLCRDQVWVLDQGLEPVVLSASDDLCDLVDPEEDLPDDVEGDGCA